MQMFDNINEFVKDDLKREIRSGSKVSIAAACFSIYAYQELKEQLSDIAELRFIFKFSKEIIFNSFLMFVEWLFVFFSWGIP